jgi:hypothetical protein
MRGKTGQDDLRLACLPSQHRRDLVRRLHVCEEAAHRFELHGNAKATRAYAWSSPLEGSDRRRFFAVLHLGGIRSPLDAVRAAIVC